MDYRRQNFTIARCRTSLLALMLTIPHGQTLANENDGVAISDDQCDAANFDASSTVIYDRDFFARYELTNADDMLRRIPGVAAILKESASGQSQRGFGSSGEQILINGNRMAGKSQNASTTLQRIQADWVHCVQLIRGTSSDIAVQSEGVIVNLVMEEQATSDRQGTWRINAKFNDQSSFGVDGLLTYGGRWKGIGYLLSLERNIWSPSNLGIVRWSEKSREEQYFYPDGTLQQDRYQDFTREHEKYIITANMEYQFSNGDEVRINAFLQPLSIREFDTAYFTAYRPDGSFDRSAIDDRVNLSEGQETFEIGVEYSREALGGKFNIITLANRSTGPAHRTRNEIDGDMVTEISRNIDHSDESEDILRGTYARPLTRDLSLELGVEGARNITDQNSQVFFDLDMDGQVEPYLFPTSHSKVKEVRAEIFAKANWSITSVWSLEGSLTGEYSEVSNNFDFVPSKDYFFTKPRLDLRYDINELNQLGLTIERTVKQLNLGNFVPSFDFADNEVDAGNLGLSPQTAWEFELRWENRLPEDAGVVEIRTFYDAIDDYLGKTIIGFHDDDPLNGDPVSATGSWGEATDLGVEIKSSLRLGWVGLPEVVIDARVELHDSEVTVPFSGEVLAFGFQRQYELGMRHDVTKWGLSYGISSKFFGSSMPSRDLNFSYDLNLDPIIDIFIEKELFNGITLRFEGNGLFPSNENRTRTLYSVSNIDGVITRDVIRTEYYDETRDRRYVISLRGTF